MSKYTGSSYMDEQLSKLSLNESWYYGKDGEWHVVDFEKIDGKRIFRRVDDKPLALYLRGRFVFLGNGGKTISATCSCGVCFADEYEINRGDHIILSGPFGVFKLQDGTIVGGISEYKIHKQG